MNIAFAISLGLSLLFGMVFAVWFGPPWRRDEGTFAWYVALSAWAQVLLDLLLFVAVVGFRVNVIVAFVVLWLQTGVTGWRLWLLLKAHRGT